MSYDIPINSFMFAWDELGSVLIPHRPKTKSLQLPPQQGAARLPHSEPPLSATGGEFLSQIGMDKLKATLGSLKKLVIPDGTPPIEAVPSSYDTAAMVESRARLAGALARVASDGKWYSFPPGPDRLAPNQVRSRCPLLCLVRWKARTSRCLTHWWLRRSIRMFGRHRARGIRRCTDSIRTATGHI